MVVEAMEVAMTLREKLADWLTGGAYELRGKLSDINGEHLETALALGERMEMALQEIAAIPVGPCSNGQTRKAVRIAREALK